MKLVDCMRTAYRLAYKSHVATNEPVATAPDTGMEAALRVVLDDMRECSEHKGAYDKYGGDWDEAGAFVDWYEKEMTKNGSDSN